VVQIVAAAVIPVLAGLDATAWVVGSAGGLIVVLEGLQQLFQSQQNWISYRSTCEALKHEKFLFLAKAGPTRRRRDPRRCSPSASRASSPKNTPSAATASSSDRRRPRTALAERAARARRKRAGAT
jgi:uncharacterized protein DUF4231